MADKHFIRTGIDADHETPAFEASGFTGTELTNWLKNQLAGATRDLETIPPPRGLIKSSRLRLDQITTQIEYLLSWIESAQPGDWTNKALVIWYAQPKPSAGYAKYQHGYIFCVNKPLS